uniref:Peptidyl-prolyl cis-trans isomerase n=1 Tax=Rhizophora mucronata TaxID=61149 RepID=A0A2P2K3N7_RHIMU
MVSTISNSHPDYFQIPKLKGSSTSGALRSTSHYAPSFPIVQVSNRATYFKHRRMACVKSMATVTSFA